jgi:putative NADH-flavin reductase
MSLSLLYIAYSLGLLAALYLRGSKAVAPRGFTGTMPTVSKLLVIGATGGTGRALVLEALERGYIVTGLARDPARLAIEHANLRVLRGDVLDPESVAEAVRGQDAVICALGHKRFFYPTRVLSAGTRILLRAMGAHGVRRLVCQTSLGIGNSAGRMGLYYTLFVIPVILPFYFWDKTRQERLIEESQTQWTIVRPSALSNAPARGSCRHGRTVGSPLWTLSVARADVARFILDELANPRYLGSTVGVTS